MAAASSDGYLYEGERKWRKSHIDILICGLFHRRYTEVQAMDGLGKLDSHFNMISSTEIWGVLNHVTRDPVLKQSIFTQWMATSPYHKEVVDNVAELKLEDRGQIVAGIANTLGDNVDTKLTELSVQKSDKAPLYAEVGLTQYQVAIMSQAAEQDED